MRGKMVARAVSVLMAAACVLASAGCKRDADVEATLGELDAFTKELVGRVESAPNPSAGVEAAQRLMDERRAEMASKVAALREVRAGEVAKGEELKNKMLESMTNNVMSVAGLQIKYMSQSMQDPTFKAKLDKLVGDYQSLFKI